MVLHCTTQSGTTEVLGSPGPAGSETPHSDSTTTAEIHQLQRYSPICQEDVIDGKGATSVGVMAG